MKKEVLIFFHHLFFCFKKVLYLHPDLRQRGRKKRSNQQFFKSSGCSTVRLVYLVWDQGVAGSNPATPTTKVHQNPKACKSYDLRAFLFFTYQFDLDNFSKNETYPVNQMNGLF